MNKKIRVAVIATVFILSSSVIVLANGLDSGLPWAQKADEQVEKMIKEKKEKYGEVTQPIIDEGGYDAYIKRASTPEQKAALQALQKDNSIGLGEWTRDALEIIGELPKDARRIKIEDVESINMKYKDESSRIKAFNKIAGAPDFQGGSGTSIINYFINGNKNDVIFVSFHEIQHFVFDEEGNATRIPLKGEIPSPEPQPTTLPNTK
jgi:hypothetical protein